MLRAGDGQQPSDIVIHSQAPRPGGGARLLPRLPLRGGVVRLHHALGEMMRRARIAAILATLVLLCTGCTDGGWLDQTRLSFHTAGIDTPLTSEPRTNSAVTGITGRGPESVVVLDVDTPALDGSRAAYSPDNGVSWRPVLFDGNLDPGMGLFNLSAVREGQWLLLGQRNGQVFAFTSSDGLHFKLQPAPVFGGTGISLNAVVGTSEGWLIAASPDDPSAGNTIALYLSSDGSGWVHRDGTAAGLPPVQGTFHPLSMAGSPTAVLLVGQQKFPDRPPASQAFFSLDGGSTWQESSPDTRDVGPAGNALWTAAWTGSHFKVTGHGWPKAVQPERYPLGISGNWTPEAGWSLAEDTAWSTQDQDIPRQVNVAHGPAGGIATQVIGQLADARSKVLVQPPGRPWSEKEMPVPDDGTLRLYSAVAAVDDGFLVAGTDSNHGNDNLRLWHVDGGGAVTDRSESLRSAVDFRAALEGPHVTGFSSARGTMRAFGSLGSQPALWELDGERNFRNYTMLVGNEPQILETAADGPGGHMLLGSSRTANSHLPVIWSRPGGGGWSEYARNIFGAGTKHGGSPVSAVLPSSHGFIAAGQYYSEGTNHAGLAVSQDGKDWDHIQSKELQGSPSGGRRISALAETSASAVLAGGSVDEAQTGSAAVWRSADARTWTAVLLPRAEGYANARVVSLTAGALRTVALVQSTATGKPARYSTFSSPDDGVTWEHGTDLDAGSPDQDVSPPRLAAHGAGFVLAATHGLPGHHVPLLMTSSDGRAFEVRTLDHDALHNEGLSVTAFGVAGKKLLIAGTYGPDGRREAFQIAVDVPGA